MELCTAGSLSNITPKIGVLNFESSSSVRRIFLCHFYRSGSRYHTKLSLKSSISDETSTGASTYVKDEPDSVITVEDTRPDDKIGNVGKVQYEASEDSSGESQLQPFEFLDKLDLKVDSDDTYSILLLGVGGLVALYLATAIVGSIDSVPVIPKLLEVVGLSYTLWFGTRYLLFKKNREELAAKIEDLKQQVLGSDDD